MSWLQLVTMQLAVFSGDSYSICETTQECTSDTESLTLSS